MTGVYWISEVCTTPELAKFHLKESTIIEKNAWLQNKNTTPKKYLFINSGYLCFILMKQSNQCFYAW